MKFSLARSLVLSFSCLLVFLVTAILLIPQAFAQVALNPDPIGVVDILDPNLEKAYQGSPEYP